MILERERELRSTPPEIKKFHFVNALGSNNNNNNNKKRKCKAGMHPLTSPHRLASLSSSRASKMTVEHIVLLQVREPWSHSETDSLPVTPFIPLMHYEMKYRVLESIV